VPDGQAAQAEEAAVVLAVASALRHLAVDAQGDHHSGDVDGAVGQWATVGSPSCCDGDEAGDAIEMDGYQANVDQYMQDGDAIM
jgi:hypothetical protein